MIAKFVSQLQPSSGDNDDDDGHDDDGDADYRSCFHPALWKFRALGRDYAFFGDLAFNDRLRRFDNEIWHVHDFHANQRGLRAITAISRSQLIREKIVEITMALGTSEHYGNGIWEPMPLRTDQAQVAEEALARFPNMDGLAATFDPSVPDDENGTSYDINWTPILCRILSLNCMQFHNIPEEEWFLHHEAQSRLSSDPPVSNLHSLRVYTNKLYQPETYEGLQPVRNDSLLSLLPNLRMLIFRPAHKNALIDVDEEQPMEDQQIGTAVNNPHNPHYRPLGPEWETWDPEETNYVFYPRVPLTYVIKSHQCVHLSTLKLFGRFLTTPTELCEVLEAHVSLESLDLLEIELDCGRWNNLVATLNNLQHLSRCHIVGRECYHPDETMLLRELVREPEDIVPNRTVRHCTSCSLFREIDTRLSAQFHMIRHSNFQWWRYSLRDNALPDTDRVDINLVSIMRPMSVTSDPSEDSGAFEDNDISGDYYPSEENDASEDSDANDTENLVSFMGPLSPMSDAASNADDDDDDTIDNIINIGNLINPSDASTDSDAGDGSHLSHASDAGDTSDVSHSGSDAGDTAMLE